MDCTLNTAVGGVGGTGGVGGFDSPGDAGAVGVRGGYWPVPVMAREAASGDMKLSS